MRNRGLVVPALFFTLAITGRSTASEERAADFARMMFGLVSATEEPCPGLPEGAGPGTAFLCARSNADFETFKAQWDQSAAGADKAPAPAKSMTDWITRGSGRIRWYAVEEKWVVVTYDASSHKLVIAYPKDRDGVLPLTKEITPPKRSPVDYTEGENRRQAREGLKSEAQGIVVLSGIVRKDGRPDTIEILGCLPRNRGLEAAAINAVKKWKYQPAMKDGAPVEVQLLASFTYGPGGFLRELDSSAVESSMQGRSGTPGGGRP